MNSVKILSETESIRDYLSGLYRRNIQKIALDLEGDRGSYRYKYAISIIQCYDGVEPVILDVLKLRDPAPVVELLSASPISKIMFSCKNDIFMTKCVFGCTILPLKDIAVAQKLLNKKINIAEHIGIDKKVKDSFQRTNWLKRPLTPDLIRYAADDVLYLLKVEEELESELKAKNLYEEYLTGSNAIAESQFIINQHEMYREKFPGYSRLPSKRKEYARTVWIFRELLGEVLNCPVGYLLSKKEFRYIIQEEDRIEETLEHCLNYNRSSDKRLKRDLIHRLFKKAEMLAKRYP